MYSQFCSLASPINCSVHWRLPYPGVYLSCLPLSLPRATSACVSVDMSTSKTGNSSLTGRFHGRMFSIDSSLGRWYSPLLHSLPVLGCLCLLTALLAFSFPSLQFVGLFSPATLFLIFSCSCWPPFWPPSPSQVCRALAGFFTARPRLHATRSRSRLIGAFVAL